MKNSESRDWCTPDWLFKQLNDEFHFDIDLTATKENSKCEYYCIDYLANTYTNRNFGKGWTPGTVVFNDGTKKDDITCFMNCPYSNPKPFIEKAWEDSQHCKIVCLVKCDPSTQWWATFWEYKTTIWEQGTSMQKVVCFAGPKPGCEVRFFPKRIKFDPPKDYYPHESKPQGSRCIMCMDASSACKWCVDNKQDYWKKKLPGPSFASALVIMDRRNV